MTAAKGGGMQGAARFHCLARLFNLGDRAAHHHQTELRHAIDHALSCDRMVRCGQRLECAWMASELADRLGRRG